VLIDSDKKLAITRYVPERFASVFVQFPMVDRDGAIISNKGKYMDNVPAGRAIRAKVVYRDPSRELSFLELEKVPLGIEAMPLAAKSLAIGATTWNIGSPAAVEQVFGVTEGKVRAIGIEKISLSKDVTIRARMITTTNPTNIGDTGGPLIDKRGYLVGVTLGVVSDGQLVSRFIDISEVRAFLNEKKLLIKELGDAAVEKPKVDPKLVTVPKKDETTLPSVDPKKETPGGTTATPAQEREATELLRRSKLFSMGEDNRPTYMAKLQEIIKKYPSTMAAKDAKKILDALK